MKKNLLWMAAAILTSGLAFTACSEDDAPVYYEPSDYWAKTSSIIDFEDGEIKEKILLDDINQVDDYYEGELWNLKLSMQIRL